MGAMLRYDKVTTRAEHVCFGCERMFPPHTKMISAAYADGGTVNSYHLCETCENIVAHMDSGEEYCFGDFRDKALEVERASVRNPEYQDG